MSELSAFEIARLRDMTPGQKLAAAFGLRRIAWRLTETGVRYRHPEFSDDQVMEEVRRLLRHAAA
jgi:hypothetical protein